MLAPPAEMVAIINAQLGNQFRLFLGVAEVLAALGLILPAVLDVAPALVAVAAVGVALLMFGAAATHLRRGEGQMVPVNLVIAAIAVFIAVMRFGPESF